MTDLNPFDIAQAQFDECAARLGLDDAMRHFLRWPQREFHVTLPVRMDDGSYKVFHGYRVQYNSARGPTKGGLRWHPDETIDTVRALAAWMTWKTAVVEIPLPLRLSCPMRQSVPDRAPTRQPPSMQRQTLLGSNLCCAWFSSLSPGCETSETGILVLH